MCVCGQSYDPTPSWLALFSRSSSWILLLLFLEQLGRCWVIWDCSSFMCFCFWARRGFCSWSLARCDGRWRALEPSLFFTKKRGWGGGPVAAGQTSVWSLVKTGTRKRKWRRIENAANRIWMSLWSLKTFFFSRDAAASRMRAAPSGQQQIYEWLVAAG